MDKPIKSANAPWRGYDVRNGTLLIGGEPVDRLAERVGQTPFFAYDRALMEERVRALRDVLPATFKLHFAIKANPMPALVGHMARLVDGLDVASGREMLTALDSGMPAREISFAGPGKTDAELRQAIAAGIVISVESSGELGRIAKLAEELAMTPPVALRVNPDYELKASGMKMGGGAKPFGIDVEQIPAVLEQAGRSAVEFVGFHIFGGSQCLDSEAIADAQRKAVDLAARLAEHAPAPVRWLNIGGGFGIPYFPNQEPLDLDALTMSMADLGPMVEDRLGKIEVMVELGRFLVGEAGVYIARIVDVKESRGHLIAVTDGGLHHHLAASGNFGQVIRKNYPVAIANRLGDDRDHDVDIDIVGCLCTPLDRLGDRVKLPRPAVGDLVAIFQSGAYGLTASPTDFLSHPRPAEILV